MRAANRLLQRSQQLGIDGEGAPGLRVCRANGPRVFGSRLDGLIIIQAELRARGHQGLLGRGLGIRAVVGNLKIAEDCGD